MMPTSFRVPSLAYRVPNVRLTPVVLVDVGSRVATRTRNRVVCLPLVGRACDISLVTPTRRVLKSVAKCLTKRGELVILIRI